MDERLARPLVPILSNSFVDVVRSFRFEKEIMGMEPGSRKQFVVQAEDAYGARDETRVKRLPRAGFRAM